MFIQESIWAQIKQMLFTPRIMNLDIQEIIKNGRKDVVDENDGNTVITFHDNNVKLLIQVEMCCKCGKFYMCRNDHLTPLKILCFCEDFEYEEEE